MPIFLNIWKSITHNWTAVISHETFHVVTANAISPREEPPPLHKSLPSRDQGNQFRRRTILLCVLVLVAAVTVFAWSRKPTAAVVATAAREVVDLVVVSGRLRAVREAAVGVEISGTVEEALVREGDRVTAGQPLARIGLIDYGAQREQALAHRDTNAAEAAAATLVATQARNDLRRTEELANGGVTSESELETARNLAARLGASETSAHARLSEDESALRLLERQLEKRTVRAPFAGVVTRRSVEPGQSVGPGAALYLVAEMTQTEIYAETDENNVDRLHSGQVATVIAPAFRNQPFQARLTQIGPRIDWDRGVIGLRLAPENPPDFLLPNMTVDVNIEVGRYPQALTLPASAVIRVREGNFVMMVMGDRFERRAVTVVGENPLYVAIEGLAPGTQVAKEATKARIGPRYQMLVAK
jgi:HlyD family secretion protein